MPDTSNYVEQIMRDYATMEPGESDTWNPVGNETELGYRLCFLYALSKCLELAAVPAPQLRVLDIGCGNGRSSRLYVDLGLAPGQITGLDVRPGAIALAQRLHPAINFETYDGSALRFAAGTFNWIQFSTVFSSVADHGHRAHLAATAMQQLPRGGHLFYLDLWRANPFAGGDRLHPEKLFAPLQVIWASPLRAHQCFPTVRDRWRLRREPGLLARLRAQLALRTRLRRIAVPSHYVMLARKID